MSTRTRCLIRHLSGLLVAAILVIARPPTAWPHHQGTPHNVPEAAIAIPNLTHGQMSVIADNRTAILALAARQVPTDRVMRRLEGFIHIQFSACLWGLMPGSLDDETSPFNECTHAYLAATQALLLHLRDMPGDHTPVQALVARIETEMFKNHAALQLCSYSDEAFNTSEITSARWSAIPRHPKTFALLMTPILTMLGLAGLGLAGLLWRRPGARPRQKPPQPEAAG